jgi:GTP cyclohydrolase FolE2
LPRTKIPGLLKIVSGRWLKKSFPEFEYLSSDYVVIIKQTSEESIHQHDAIAELRATMAELRR